MGNQGLTTLKRTCTLNYFLKYVEGVEAKHFKVHAFTYIGALYQPVGFLTSHFNPPDP